MTGVVFDFGNVLYDVDYAKMATRLAGRDGPALLRGFQGSAMQMAYESGRAGLEDLLQELSRLGYPVAEAQFLEAFLDVFTPVPGMAEVVARLARRRPLGLLSNTCPEHARLFIERAPELRHIPSRVYSFEVGCMKPDPGIYSAAVRAVGVAGEELVFVDDVPEFAAAAASAGMVGVPFRGAAQLSRRLVQLGFTELAG